MNSDQIRISVAEELGYVNINSACWRGHLNGFERSVPDYPSSLDACREFEEKVKQEELAGYDVLIDEIVMRDWDESGPLLVTSFDWHASALQRCESFLRLRGRWIETPKD